MVLLCAALVFQVLTFMRHTGFAYLGIPIPPDQGLGLSRGHTGAGSASSLDASSLIGGGVGGGAGLPFGVTPPFTNSVLSLPESDSHSTNRRNRSDAKVEPTVRSAHSTGSPDRNRELSGSTDSGPTAAPSPPLAAGSTEPPPAPTHEDQSEEVGAVETGGHDEDSDTGGGENEGEDGNGEEVEIEFDGGGEVGPDLSDASPDVPPAP